MAPLDSSSATEPGAVRELGVVAFILCGSFVGGAAIGVVVIGLLLGVAAALFLLVTFLWGFWLPSGPWVEILVLGGLAGGATGVLVGLLGTLARWFGTDESGGDANALVRDYLNRAVAYGKLGQWEEAVADTTAALELGPSEPNQRADALWNRAAAYAALGQWQYAIVDATATIGLSETLSATYNPAWAHAIRGRAYGQLGHKDLARSDLARAMRLSDDPALAKLVRDLATEFGLAP